MKFGLFGGAFDPLHNEHVELMELVYKKANLDALILVPSKNPPHKDKGLASFKDRLMILREFAKDKPYVIIDSIESTSKRNSYAYEIIPQLINKYGGEFIYIIGGDSLVDFDTWKRPDLILKLVPLLVFSRANYTSIEHTAREQLLQKYGGSITILDYVGSGVSSSQIKAQIETGFIDDAQIPGYAKLYIIEHNLYKTHSNIVDKLKANISTELFVHCARTAIYATAFCTKLRLNYKDVFLATLLHDCAKETKPLKSEYPTISRKVIHQYDGKTLANELYGIEDPLILDAIEYHTTGKPKMSVLGKLVYVADKLESGRDFDGITEIRNLVKYDFEKGFIKLLERSTTYVMSKGLEIDPLTKETYDYYVKL
ncbi:MAG: nicotinate (nicotinamide) nucleotide adenylyltransferase [Christensenellaceae bacterium]|jgi:nicotinate-nucleotide adenylyltransferase|nr:nicotinate (nicotinamide) nucleotide adenylyltransferase [Christensenellaceae bacterium]